jgi:hypothetical protein
MSGHSSRRGQGDDPGPPHPSARLPWNTLVGNSDPTDAGLNRHRQGLPPSEI